MTPGSNEPMGGFAPEVDLTQPEDRYDWPLTFRHVDRLTVKHLEILGEYLTTFSKVLSPEK